MKLVISEPVKLKAYSNVVYNRDKLFVRGIDENFNRVSFYTDFTPTVWVDRLFNYHEWKKDIINIDFNTWRSFIGDEKLVGLTFKNIKSCREFVKANTHFVKDLNGNKVITNVHSAPSNMFVAEYIAKNFPNNEFSKGVDCSKFKVYTYDIETEIGHRNVSDRSKVKIRLKQLDEFVKVDTNIQTMTIMNFESIPNHDRYQLLNEETGEWVDYDEHPYRYIGGFPKPMEATEKVTLITVKNVNENKIFTWGLEKFINKRDDVTYFYCKSEEELLESFLSFLEDDYPDIFLGFNSRSFDNTYMFHRIKNVLGEENAQRLSPVRDVEVRVVEHNEYGHTVVETKFKGMQELDYLALYKKFTYGNRESYRLDSIAEDEIGTKKIPNPTGGSFKDFYSGKFIVLNEPNENDDPIKKMGYQRTLLRRKVEEAPNNEELLKQYKSLDQKIIRECKQRFIEYNIRDVELIDKIDAKQKFIDLAMTIGYLAHCNFENVFSPVQTWDYMIFENLYQQNKVIPIKQGGQKKEKFAGAYVKAPIVGPHRFCCSFDLDSLLIA